MSRNVVDSICCSNEIEIEENVSLYYNDNVFKDEWLYASFFFHQFFVILCKNADVSNFSGLSTF